IRVRWVAEQLLVMKTAGLPRLRARVMHVTKTLVVRYPYPSKDRRHRRVLSRPVRLDTTLRHRPKPRYAQSARTGPRSWSHTGPRGHAYNPRPGFESDQQRLS